MFPVFIWKLENTQQTTFLESSYGRFQKIRSHTSVLCNKKRRTDVTWSWNIAAIPGQNESVVSLITKKKNVHLNSRIYHTSNARMHASYMLCSTTRKRTQRSWVVPCEMYLSPNIQSTLELTNLCVRLEQIAFVLKRIAPQGWHEICKTIYIFLSCYQRSNVSMTRFA